MVCMKMYSTSLILYTMHIHAYVTVMVTVTVTDTVTVTVRVVFSPLRLPVIGTTICHTWVPDVNLIFSFFSLMSRKSVSSNVVALIALAR
jgi:hypothetical protein